MQNKNQKGYVVLFAVIFLAILGSFAASLLRYTTINLRGARQSQAEDQALYIAQGGLEKAIYQLNHDSSYSGESGTVLGNGEFSVTVTTLAGNSKRISVSSYVPNSLKPTATKIIKATVGIDASTIAFNTGVQVGPGGLDMDNNSTVSGNIFSGGNITGGNADITGDAIVAQASAATADEEWTVYNNDFNFGNLASRRDVSQSFKPGSTDLLTKVEVYIRKIGDPGDLTVRILANNSSDPSRTVLTSGTIPASSVTGSYGWAEATFSNPISLSGGETYWLTLSTASVNSSNYYFWGTDNNNGYGNGVCKYSSNWNAGSPVWTLVLGDCNYKTFMGGVTTYFDGGIDVGGNVRATEIRDCGSITDTAYYDTVFSSCSAGTSSAGNNAPGPEAMPISQAQIDEWKTTATNGGVMSGNYTVNGVETLGPVKIDGDLLINTNAVLNITGPIWVNGNITFLNNTTLHVADSLGNAGTVLLASDELDSTGSGIIDISNNTIIEGNGNPNSYPLIITESSNATGALYVNNNSAGAIYYASEGTIEVSNNAGGNQITGYKVHLNENASIVYSNGLANATFSNGPGASWRFVAGTYVEE